MIIPKTSTSFLLPAPQSWDTKVNNSLLKRSTTNGGDGNISAPSPSPSATSTSSSSPSVASTSSPATSASSSPFPPSNISPSQTSSPDSQGTQSQAKPETVHILVAVLMLVLVIISAAGVMWYFKRHPEKWRKTSTDSTSSPGTAAEERVGDEEHEGRDGVERRRRGSTCSGDTVVVDIDEKEGREEMQGNNLRGFDKSRDG